MVCMQQNERAILEAERRERVKHAARQRVDERDRAAVEAPQLARARPRLALIRAARRVAHGVRDARRRPGRVTRQRVDGGGGGGGGV